MGVVREMGGLEWCGAVNRKPAPKAGPVTVRALGGVASARSGSGKGRARRLGSCGVCARADAPGGFQALPGIAPPKAREQLQAYVRLIRFNKICNVNCFNIVIKCILPSTQVPSLLPGVLEWLWPLGVQEAGQGYLYLDLTAEMAAACGHCTPSWGLLSTAEKGSGRAPSPCCLLGRGLGTKQVSCTRAAGGGRRAQSGAACTLLPQPDIWNWHRRFSPRQHLSRWKARVSEI